MSLVRRNGSRAAWCAFHPPQRYEYKVAHVPPGSGKAAAGHEELCSCLWFLWPVSGGKPSWHLFITKPTECECRTEDFDILKVLFAVASHFISSSFFLFCHTSCHLLWFSLQTHAQSQRALLLQGTDSLNSASQSIERSQRIANETEQIGTDIIEELGEQREQLDRTRNRVSCELLFY